MKTVSAKSFFKVVSNKSADVSRWGMKRPDLEWQYRSFESMAEVAQESERDILDILNRALEDFGRKLVADNGDNWDYCPGIDDITVSALATSLRTVADRSRLITKETLASAGKWYATYAHLIGKLPQAAKAGQVLLSEKFSQIAGKTDALTVMRENLATLLAHSEESDNETFLQETLEVSAVIEACIGILDNLIVESQQDLASLI